MTVEIHLIQSDHQRDDQVAGRPLPPQRIVTLLAQNETGHPVGWCTLCDHLHGNPLPARELFMDVAVAPGERQQGIGRQLAVALLEQARANGTTSLVTCADTEDAAGLTLAASLGFTPDYQMLVATLNLEGYDLGPWLTAVTKAGVRFASLAEAPDPEAAARAVWELDYHCSADIPEWAGEVIPFEQYRTAMLAGPEFDPHGVILAWEGERPVGFCATSIQADGTGYTNMLGVERALRGRGIAVALKALTIDWAKRKGLTRLQTHNNRANEAIVTLNVKMGYVIDGATQYFRRNLI